MKQFTTRTALLLQTILALAAFAMRIHLDAAANQQASEEQLACRLGEAGFIVNTSLTADPVARHLLPRCCDRITSIAIPDVAAMQISNEELAALLTHCSELRWVFGSGDSMLGPNVPANRCLDTGFLQQELPAATVLVTYH